MNEPTHVAPLLATWRRMGRWPAGPWLFSRAVCFKAPYFSTISPRFVSLEPGRCEVRMGDRRRVHNHIGSVHAIALCNLAELAGGVMLDASLPKGMRWIPKGMTVAYLARAHGTLHAIATPASPIVTSSEGYELPVTVEVQGSGEAAVFRADITMWVSPRRPPG